jgi:hypothetical protein
MKVKGYLIGIERLPLQKSSFSPATALEKSLLVRSVNYQLGTPRGRYNEHNSNFYLSKKPRFNRPVGERNHL